MLRVFCSLLGLAALVYSQPLPSHLTFVHPAPGSVRVPTNTILASNRGLNGGVTIHLRLATNPEVEIPLRRVVPVNYEATYFRPETSLRPNTIYQVTIATLQGDYPAPFSYFFSTGDGADQERPRLLSVTPATGTVLRVGQPVRFTFQEPLLHAGGNQPGFGWRNVVTHSVDRPAVSDNSSFRMQLSPDRRTISVYPPAGALAFRLSMFADAFMDLAGNTGAAQAAEVFDYYRRLASDAAPVLVTHSFPEEGQVAVHRAASVQLLFNQEASSAIVAGAESFLELTREGQKEAFQVSSFANGRGLLVNPRNGVWQAEARYSLRVKARTLQGFSAPMEEDFTLNFQTGEQFLRNGRPYIQVASSSRYPADSRIVVEGAAMLPVWLPEALQEVRVAAEGAPNQVRSVAVLAEVSEDRQTLTITPRQGWPVGQQILQLPKLEDGVGNPLPMRQAMRVGAGPIPSEPPTVYGTTPTEGAVPVPVTVIPAVSLSTPISPVQPELALVLWQDGKPLAGTIAAVVPSRLEFRPAEPLQPDTEYLLEARAVTDVTGRAAPGRAVRFRTVPRGYVPPRSEPVAMHPLPGPPLAGMGPLNPEPGNRGVIQPQQELQFRFNRPVGGAELPCQISVELPDGAGERTLLLVPVLPKWEGSLLRLLPVPEWPAGLTLQVVCAGGDLWGSGERVSGTYRVVTASSGAGPRLLSAEPAAGATLRPGDRVRLTFSEPVLEAAYARSGFAWTEVPGGGPVAEVAWSADRLTAVVGVPPGEGRALLVPTDGLRGFHGIAAAPFAVAYQVTTSPAASKPSILGNHPNWQLPLRNSNLELSIFLDRPVPLAAIQAGLRVFADELLLEGEWRSAPSIAAETAYTFVPQQPFPPGSFVRTVDFGGVLALESPSGYLSVAPTPQVGRYITRFNGGSLPADGRIEVEFSEEVPEQHFDMTVSLLRANEPLVPISGRWRRVRPRVLAWQPEAPMEPGTYRLRAGPVFRNPLVERADTLWPIDEEVSILPVVETARTNIRAVLPLEGEKGVASNTSIVVLLEGRLNPLTLNERTAVLRVNQVERPVEAVLAQGGVRLILPALLPANSEVEVELRELEDLAGRAYPAKRWTFTTGKGADVQPARVMNPQFSTGSKKEPVGLIGPNQGIALRYDKALDPLDPLSPFYRFGGVSVEQKFSEDFRTVRYTFAGGWTPGRLYSFDTATLDMQGLRCGPSNGCPKQEFRVGLQDDTTAPGFVAASVQDGEGNVPRNPYFTFLFDSPVGETAAGQVQLWEGTTRLELQAGATAPESANVVRVTPVATLRPLTDYQIVLEGISDAAGNPMAGRYVFRFRTGRELDYTAPAVTGPATVPADRPVRLRFSEAMDLVGVQAGARTLFSGLERGSFSSARGQWPARLEMQDGGRELVLYPERPLPVGERITVNLTEAYDRAGNRAVPLPYTFVVLEAGTPELAPLTLQLYPPDGSTGVSPSTVLSATPSRQAGVQLRLVREGQAAAVQQVNSNWLRVALLPNTRYRLEATASDSLAVAGGVVGPLESTFTTGEAAPAAPFTLLESTPANEAAEVPVDATVTLLFSQPMHPAANHGRGIVASTAGSVLPFGPAVQAEGARLTVKPRELWPPATAITLQALRTFSFEEELLGPMDINGRNLSQTVSRTFRTGASADREPPTAELFPPPGSEIPATSSSFARIRFSKPVILPLGALVVQIDGRVVANSCDLSLVDLRTCRIALPVSPRSKVVISGTNAIRDISGNAITPFIWELMAGDAIVAGPVTVQLSEPSGPRADATVLPVVRFSTAMDEASVQANLRVTADGLVVSGSLESFEGGRAFRFRPVAPFAAGAEVTVVISYLTAATSGRQLGEWKSFSFVVTGGKEAFTQLQVRQANLLSLHPANAPLVIDFKQELVADSVHGDSVWLAAHGQLVPAKVECVTSRQLQVTPKSALTPGWEYTLTLGTGLRGKDGEIYPGGRIVFAVGEVATPEISRIERGQWRSEPSVRIHLTHAITVQEATDLRDEYSKDFGATEWLIAPDGKSLFLFGEKLLMPAGWKSGERVPLRQRRLPRPASN